ncbi:hypothetical protein G6F57_010949 [Rhizopus arrhizus]|nr:hypothetical protein G6F57_010949 [Rhizopus arrhizus]
MSNRRHFLTQLAGAAGLGGLAALGLAGLPGRVAAAGPGAGIWRMPDEHGPQERVVLALAAQPRVWGAQADAGNTARAVPPGAVEAGAGSLRPRQHRVPRGAAG